MAPAVPPLRNTSASSMQSPPDAPRPPGSAACLPGSPAPARLPGRRGCRRLHAGPGAGLGSPGAAAQHWPPGGGRQTRFGCDRDGCVVASIGCSLFWGRLCCSKTTLSQIHRSTLLPLQDTDPTPSFGGFGLSHAHLGAHVLTHRQTGDTIQDIFSVLMHEFGYLTGQDDLYPEKCGDRYDRYILGDECDFYPAGGGELPQAGLPGSRRQTAHMTWPASPSGRLAGEELRPCGSEPSSYSPPR